VKGRRHGSGADRRRPLTTTRSGSARALVTLLDEGVTVRAHPPLRPDRAGRGPAAPTPCRRVESLRGARWRRPLCPPISRLLAHVPPPVLAARDAASDGLPGEGPLQSLSAAAAGGRPGAPGIAGCPGAGHPFRSRGGRHGLQNRAPSPVNSGLHVSLRGISFPRSRRALVVETARRAADRPTGPPRRRRRSGDVPEHAGLIRPPAILRAIPLRHPSHLQVHVGPPCRACINEMAEGPQRRVKPVAAEVKGVSRVEAEAATPCLETFLMGTGSDLTAPYGQVASNA